MFNEQIGHRIRKCRERAYLSVRDVGNMTGTEVKDVEKWERGELEPAKRHWEKLEIIFGVPADIITDPSVDLPKPEGTDEERVQRLLDSLDAQRSVDTKNFFRKFPVWQLCGVAYFVVCALRMGRGMLLFDAYRIWLQMLPILLPIPIWYGYWAIRKRKEKRANG